MAETSMHVKVPEEVIRAHISAAVADIIAKDPKELVRQCVNAAMTAKVNSYDRETIFEQQVAKMIRDMAKQVFAEWLEQRRDDIRDAIVDRLKRSPQKFVRELADKTVSALALSYRWKVEIGMGSE